MKYSLIWLIGALVAIMPLRANEQNVSDGTATLEQLKNLANSYRYNHPDSAEYYYKRALQMAIKQQLASEEAIIISSIGAMYYIRGDYFQALEKFTESLDKFRGLNDQKGVAAGLNNCGMIFCVQKKHRLSITQHRRSLEICRQIHDTLLEERNLFNLAIVYSDMGKNDSALYYAQKAREINLAKDYRIENLRLSNLFGEIYYQMGDYQESFKSYMDVLNAADFDNKWEKGYAFAGIARTGLKLGYTDQAIEYATASFQMASEIKALWDMTHVAEILAEAYAQKGDFKEAYRYQVKFKSLSDSLLNEANEREMNHLHLLEQEAENRKLMHQSEKQQMALKRKNQMTYIYVVGFVLFSILVFLLWRNLRLKSKMNKSLQAKNSIIAHKNQELEHANATKDRFFHLVAHDLKSPLSVMISFTDVLQQNLAYYDEEKIREFLTALHQSSLQGFRLLENLLDWARLQTNAITYDPDKLKIYPLVEETRHLLGSNAKDKNIEVKTDVDEQLMAVIDRNMFLTVLRNLLSNAIKFSEEGSTVTISAKKTDDRITITVTDTGVGIPKADMDKLFRIETYYTRPGTKKEKGTGLGLILCHDFVRKMGGQLNVESTEGKGSVFSFWVGGEKNKV